MDSSRLFTVLAVLSLLVLLVMRALFGTTGLIISGFLILFIDLTIYYFSPHFIINAAGGKILERNTAPELFHIVEGLAQQAQIPTPQVFMTPDPQPNIFTVGRNTHAATILVTRGLIEVLNPEELRAVVAHEIGHIAHNDILIETIAATLCSLLTWMLPKGNIQSTTKTGVGNSFSSLLVLFIAPIASSIIKFTTSNTAEFKADFVGASLTREPLQLAKALEKINMAVEEHIPLLHGNPALAHLFIAYPFHSQTLTTLFSTHPSLQERIDRLRSMLV